MTKAKNRTPTNPRSEQGIGHRGRGPSKRTKASPVLADRVRLLVATWGEGSKVAFARALGVQTSQVSNWSAEPGAHHLSGIAELMGISLDWLLLGIGGDEPVYREEGRTRAEFMDEFRAYVARRAAPQIAA